ncbi:MAG: FxLYD domain-containing protein [Atopobiaceae bacterium]
MEDKKASETTQGDESTPVASPEGASAPKKKRHVGRIVLIVVAVLVLLCVIAGMSSNSSKKDDEPFDPSTYQKVDYATVAKNPDDYKGQKLYFEGKVIQVVEGNNETDLRVATNSNGYDDVIYVAYDPSILNGSHLVEGQYLGVYGHCNGQISYTSTLGGKISIPGLTADSFDQDVKSPQQVQVETMQALFDGVEFKKVDTSGYGSYEYQAQVKNTTENNYSNVELTLGIYDASGTRIGETYASVNTWAAGETAQFDGYLDSDKAEAAASVKVEIQGFSIGSDYYSPNQS